MPPRAPFWLSQELQRGTVLGAALDALALRYLQHSLPPLGTSRAANATAAPGGTGGTGSAGSAGGAGGAGGATDSELAAEAAEAAGGGDGDGALAAAAAAAAGGGGGDLDVQWFAAGQARMEVELGRERAARAETARKLSVAEASLAAAQRGEAMQALSPYMHGRAW